jgi:plasmid stability protein
MAGFHLKQNNGEGLQNHWILCLRVCAAAHCKSKESEVTVGQALQSETTSKAA